MPRLTVTQHVRAPAEVTWSTLTDWPRHGHWVPFTTVRVTTGRPGGVGAGFSARTGIGRFAFDDPMTVVVWEPPDGDRPGRCEVRKQGDAVRGRAWFTVSPRPGGHSRVLWGEEVTVWPHRWTRLTAPVVELAGWAAFKSTLMLMAREAERGR